MGPRKKSKRESSDGSNGPSGPANAQGPEDQATDGQSMQKDSQEQTQMRTPSGSSRTIRPKKSWYGGTWSGSSKGAPITEVARESISAATSKLSVASSENAAGSRSPSATRQKPSTTNSPSVYLSRAIQNSTRSLPVKPSSSQDEPSESSNVFEGATNSSASSDHHRDSDRDVSAKSDNTKKSHVDPGLAPNEETPKKQDEHGDETKAMNEQPKPSLWFGWLGNKTTEGPEDQRGRDQSGVLQLGEAPKEQETHDQQVADGQDNSRGVSLSREAGGTSRSDNSWFGSWTPRSKPASTLNQGADGSDNVRTVESDKDTSGTVSSAGEVCSSEETAQRNVPSTNSAGNPLDSYKRGSWVFWSREKALPSESQQPKRTTEYAPKSTGDSSASTAAPDANLATSDSKANSIRLGKRGRPASLENADSNSNSHLEVQTLKGNRPTDSLNEPLATKAAPPKAISRVQSPNLLLPSLYSTYQLPPSLSLMQHIAHLFYKSTDEPTHVHLTRDPPRIRKALAVGVHGYFPAPVLRPVLGQPTGTSVRFANSAAQAITKWTQKRQIPCEIEKIALEGEGRIAERVDSLWKLMLDWIDKIKQADFILFACHSQGVPVTLILAAKLVEFGCVSAARIGFCAMAGVNLGPFPDFKSRLWSGSASELFEFANPSSEVSKRYQESLKIVLNHGARILFVGSIDDQLVSLESSTFSTISHPYVYRAVFVDGRVHVPDFITHLVGFALKVRNLGVSDHGLIRELSSPLAGSLYTGEGHSRLYDDEVNYDLAVALALETTSFTPVPALSIRPDYSPPSSSSSNPFILPWAMRGLLEEQYVRDQLHDETSELLEQFEKWTPATKGLKDVKWRLEAVRSKL